MLTLPEIKTHLRISHDFEDEYLLALADAAMTHIEAVTNRDFSAELPSNARLAALLLVGLWYENRTAATDKKLEQHDFAVSALLWPLRRNLLGQRSNA